MRPLRSATAALVILSASAVLSGSSRDYPIRPVDFTKVRITDTFWRPRLETNRRVTIPFALQKCRETGRIDNFLRAARKKPGPYLGKRYNDSDVYKIIEGASYALRLAPDKALDQDLDEVIASIAGAQEPDGYLYAARTVNPADPPPGAGPERWSLLESSHELYNVGHLYEAAAAHFQATGKRTLLAVALKNADFITKIFGPDKRFGFPGHQEIEIGLTKLTLLTGERKYLDLARYFLEARGRRPYRKPFPEDSAFAVYNRDWYLQAHKPVLEQKEAVGHAVRATYMYAAMADVAALAGDARFLRAGEVLWRDVTSGKIYLTGGLGARSEGEAFGARFELPNAEAYNETCAAIGGVLWNHRLFLSSGESRYLDVLERILYNGLISGVSLSGDLFFYTNPLESDGHTGFNQGAPTRQPWFEVACCPGNLARFLPSLPGYLLAQDDDTVYVNLFIRSEAALEVKKTKVKLSLDTDYPWDGSVRISLEAGSPVSFRLAVRIPCWAIDRPLPGGLYSYLDKSENHPVLKVNGERQNISSVKGYASLERLWRPGDVVEIEFPMPPRRVASREEVEAGRGRTALVRGPLVYCFEAADNDGHVCDRCLPDDMTWEVVPRTDLLGGVLMLRGRSPGSSETLTALPYYAWSHRGAGEMAVWLKRSPQ